jgi:type II secretory pathway component PulM
MPVVATLGLVAAGILLCLVLFLFAKVEIWRLSRRTESGQQRMQACLEELRQTLEEMRVALRDLEERTGVLVPPTPPRSGLNLTTRAQALRMLRRGETTERIAAALHVPESEVRLLIKVHQLTSAQGQAEP